MGSSPTPHITQVQSGVTQPAKYSAVNREVVDSPHHQSLFSRPGGGMATQWSATPRTPVRFRSWLLEACRSGLTGPPGKRAGGTMLPQWFESTRFRSLDYREMPEWFNGTVSKTVGEPNLVRGFESHSLCCERPAKTGCENPRKGASVALPESRRIAFA